MMTKNETTETNAKPEAHKQNSGIAQLIPAAGPYFYLRTRDGVDDIWKIVSLRGDTIASYEFWDDGNGKSERIEANFRLLAAAPSLLVAIMAVLKVIDNFPFNLFPGAMAKVREMARNAVNEALP